MLEIDNQTSKSISVEIIKAIYKFILEKEIREEKEVSLLLVDEGRSRYYNNKYRGKDSETDVISFSTDLAFLPAYGDIIIDLSVAETQKGTRNLTEEVAFLFIHGLLHLLGYDHLSQRDKEIMENKEIKYYNMIKKEILL